MSSRSLISSSTLIRFSQRGSMLFKLARYFQTSEGVPRKLSVIGTATSLRAATTARRGSDSSLLWFRRTRPAGGEFHRRQRFWFAQTTFFRSLSPLPLVFGWRLLQGRLRYR